MSGEDGVEDLAERVRATLDGRTVTEKRMFGGITFMLDGNMLCCVSKQGLMVRVGKDAEPQALRLSHARPCTGTGRRMPGFVVIGHEGLRSATDFCSGLDLALRYVSALPPKTPSSKPASRRSKSTHRPPGP